MVPIDRDRRRSQIRLNIRRGGRVVECGGLENRCSPSGEPGVRIPLSPQTKLLPQLAAGFLIHSWPNQACLKEDRYELKKFIGSLPAVESKIHSIT